jgi:hypothetical protein
MDQSSAPASNVNANVNAAPRVMSEQERMASRGARFGDGARLQREAEQRQAQVAATVGANAANARIDTVGGRWWAHLTDHGGDGTAGMSAQQAENLVRNTADPEPYGQGGRYIIRYGRGLCIIYSTPDAGRTISVFHIGPSTGV